jgi:hypothetical protein
MTRKAFLIRINQKLWEDLNSWAKDEFRSINGQIEYILTKAVNEKRKKTDKNKETGE